jgi:hypothetical protein
MIEPSPGVPFRLVPFPDGAAEILAIEGSAARTANGFSVEWRLSGDLVDLVVPARAEAPSRRDGLWRSTCLELFVAARGEPGYLELNLSPSGDWNLYRFDGYREGMSPVAGARLESSTSRSDRLLSIACELELDAPPAPSVDAGVSAVVARAGGATRYFALAHTAERPDFHRRDAFLLAL